MRIITTVIDYIKASLLTTRGDLLKHDGVSIKRFPIGAAKSILRVNWGGDDLGYIGPEYSQTYLTTKGDMVKYDGFKADRFPIGTAGQIIRVNAVPDDLEFQNSTDLFQKARVYRNITSFNNPLTTWAVFQYNEVDFDPASLWDAGNFRFIPKHPGYYIVGAHLYDTGIPEVTGELRIQLLHNDTIEVESSVYNQTAGSKTLTLQARYIRYFNGTTDNARVKVWQNYANPTTFETGLSKNFFDIIGPF